MLTAELRFWCGDCGSEQDFEQVPGLDPAERLCIPCGAAYLKGADTVPPQPEELRSIA
jgi:hypothetical protein